MLKCSPVRDCFPATPLCRRLHVYVWGHTHTYTCSLTMKERRHTYSWVPWGVRCSVPETSAPS